MSRTDKDKPHWVRAQWYVPVHTYCQFDDVRWGWHRFPDGPRECNLPETPVYGDYKAPRWRNRTSWDCYWEAQWPFCKRYCCTRGPKKSERSLGWWGPDRRLVRDQCRKALQEYRGSGDVEIVVSTQHHNHGPNKGWGWWD